MKRKVPTRWTRPAPARKLPPACAPEGGQAAISACRESGCLPGGCCLAIGYEARRRGADGDDAWEPCLQDWWHRRTTDAEDEALEACRLLCPKPSHERVVAGLADECWRAGCPLEEPDASRRGAVCDQVPGCPGFCSALPPQPPRPMWRLEGWVRELSGDEVAAIERVALGFRLPSDLGAVSALADECCACWPCSSPPRKPAPARDGGCPGFCQLESAGRWS